MGKFSAADKLTKLNEFIKNFTVRLEALYTLAKLGPQPLGITCLFPLDHIVYLGDTSGKSN